MAAHIPGILQARTLEWVAISFSNAWKWSRSISVWLLATPWAAAHQAPPSLGFSRQEYWSGLPFPSPMRESEKWKWSRSISVWLLATPRTAAYQPPPSMVFSRQEYWVAIAFSEIFLWARVLRGGGGSKNTGVGCYSLLQEIFRTQGLNPGLPHCRQTLYCLSHHGSDHKYRKKYERHL